MKDFTGQKVLIRTYSAGVHFGTFSKSSADFRQVLLENARRVHYWDGAASLSQMAVSGVSSPANCRFSVPVAEILLTEAIEILPLTTEAYENLKNVSEWKA